MANRLRYSSAPLTLSSKSIIQSSMASANTVNLCTRAQKCEALTAELLTKEPLTAELLTTEPPTTEVTTAKLPTKLREI